ncbi:MAG: beta-L-arabinofuranosidase domain-containing protein [Phycisphaerae bacterium]
MALWEPHAAGQAGGASTDRAPRDDRRFVGQLRPVEFAAVRLEDSFWAPRIETVRRNTLPHCLEQCEATGRLANFDRAAGRERGAHQGWFFNDSDVYKVVEGAANLLALRRDADLEQRVAALIDRIAAAQQPDGYLNTYYTLHPDEKRWSDIGVRHELYCAGHLLEAGLALHAATGDERLLEVARRFVAHIRATFGPGRRADPPGHEEIELALLRLWRLTGDDANRDLARFFVDQRGRADGRKLYGEYSQDHAPLAQQREIVGHAVRALYLYSAATELLDESTRAEAWSALQALWHDAVETKMYVTGGIGNSSSNEGFTHSYDLPNDTAYAETCAAIALVFWAHRMNLQTADARYFDVVERALFNGVLSGISLDGRQFFYTNPLASRGQHRRQDWYACACCPTNLVRMLPTVGGYAYAVDREGTLFVNLYVQSSARIPLRPSPSGVSSGETGPALQIRQRTRYPWDGAVELDVAGAPDREFTLALRIPGWCRSYSLRVNGERHPTRLSGGYARITRRWADADRVALAWDMPIERVESDPRVVANRGRVALQRGPLVYCIEGVDQPDAAPPPRLATRPEHDAATRSGFTHVRRLALPCDTELRIDEVRDLPGGMTTIRGAGLVPVADNARWSRERPLYRVAPESLRQEFVAIPYYTWANRAPAEMVVWIPESPALVDPGPVAGVTASASHCFSRDTVDALCDGVEPQSSHDASIPRFTWWPRRGSQEWVQYDFRAPRTISAVAVYWFDDTGQGGGCALPASRRVQVRVDGEWRDADAGVAPSVPRDDYDKLRFTPVRTDGVRLEVQLQPGRSAGILEWAVEFG